MPLLNDVDEVYKGSTRVDAIYAGSVLVWPRVETWSAWYEVGTAVLAAPCAWFAAGWNHYDAGAHERVRFRYSNFGRVHWRGIMINNTGGPQANGSGVIGCRIEDPNVPDPAAITRMLPGPGGVASTGSQWGGGFVRFDARPYEYHHLLVVGNVDGGVPVPNGGWVAIDGILAFSADS